MTYQDFFSRYIYNRRDDKICNTRFGAIYKATERKKGREVFLRLMPVDESTSPPTLRDEVELANSLPLCDAVVRYTDINRFEEATGELDCAIMPFFPLGSLAKVLEDWKLDNGERRQLRDAILSAATFLRSNSVPLGNFNPNSVFISQDGDKLLPHFIDFGFTDDISPEVFAEQVSSLLPVDPEPVEEAPEEVQNEPVVSEPTPAAPESTDEEAAEDVEEVSEPTVDAEPQIAEESPRAQADTDSENEEGGEMDVEDEAEEAESNSRKWRLLGGVAVTWIAIIGLIYAVHLQRNERTEETEKVATDSIAAPVYPADEFVKEEAARADSIAKAREDSIAAFKADSIAYMKKIAAEKEAKVREREEARKREAEKSEPTAEPESKPAVHESPAAVEPAHHAPTEPAE